MKKKMQLSVDFILFIMKIINFSVIFNTIIILYIYTMIPDR